MYIVEMISSEEGAKAYKLAAPGAHRARAWDIRNPKGVWVGIYVFDRAVGKNDLLTKLEEIFSTTGWEVEPVVLR